MLDAYREVERHAEVIRAFANNPAAEKALDEILVKCSAYMEPDQTPPGLNFGLSKSRAKMFGLLFKRKGQTVSRAALLNVCDHQADSEPSLKMLDVHMHRIRKAIQGTALTIETIFGAGYRLTESR